MEGSNGKERARKWERKLEENEQAWSDEERAAMSRR